MKKANLFRNHFICALMLSALFLGGCKEEKKFISAEDTITLSVNQAEDPEYADFWNRSVTNKRLCIVFGYDFNSTEIVEQYKSLLEEKYGLEENGGMIMTLTYPDDFKHTGKTYITDLKNYLSDSSRDFCGVVILGAPENTHIALARLQDEWNMEIPYPVIALFPQDDVLGLESTCDLVIDRLQTGDMAEEEFANDELFIYKKAPSVLFSAIDYMIKLASPLPKNATIQQNVLQMFNNEKIAHYMDPETGLQSINHFILY